jgi:hypothetical protein
MKPCPFCGLKATLGKFLVGCSKCSLFFSFHPKIESQKDLAIQKWNTRCSKI